MVNKMVNRIKRTLTRRQKEILDKIQDFILDHGYAPTVREIGQMTGLTNPSAVFKHLLSLEKKGYLRREGGELRLTYLPDAVNQVRLPLVGLVPAGSLDVEPFSKGPIVTKIFVSILTLFSYVINTKQPEVYYDKSQISLTLSLGR